MCIMSLTLPSRTCVSAKLLPVDEGDAHNQESRGGYTAETGGKVLLSYTCQRQPVSMELVTAVGLEHKVGPRGFDMMHVGCHRQPPMLMEE